MMDPYLLRKKFAAAGKFSGEPSLPVRDSISADAEIFQLDSVLYVDGQDYRMPKDVDIDTAIALLRRMNPDEDPRSE